MKVSRFPPSEALAPYVRTFEVVETSGPIVRTLVPETGLVLGFRYAGSATLLEGTGRLEVPREVLTGLRATARRMQTSAGGGMVLAKFHMGGAARFFDTPLHELFGTMAPLRKLVDAGELDATAARVQAAGTHRERVAALEQFLRGRLANTAWRADPVVRAALRELQADPAALRVGALARRLGVSLDALEKRFRRRVGATPKQLASILRLRRAIEGRQAAVSLTQLAVDAGYYDQAHFVRHFVAAMDAPPKRFLATDEFCA